MCSGRRELGLMTLASPAMQQPRGNLVNFGTTSGSAASVADVESEVTSSAAVGSDGRGSVDNGGIGGSAAEADVAPTSAADAVDANADPLERAALLGRSSATATTPEEDRLGAAAGRLNASVLALGLALALAFGRAAPAFGDGGRPFCKTLIAAIIWRHQSGWVGAVEFDSRKKWLSSVRSLFDKPTMPFSSMVKPFPSYQRRPYG